MLLGLGLTVVPAFLVFAGRLTWDTHAVLMAVVDTWEVNGQVKYQKE